MKPSIKTLMRMFTSLNADESNVDFSDVDYHAEQIENIFEVTEIEAYELANQLKESTKMSEFTMTGFYHVSKNGVIAFWQYLEQQGSLDLLYDMKPDAKINELMLSEAFDLDAHIKTNYPRENYDNILIEINDEMLDAITALEFCFATNQTQISFNGRSFENLDCIHSTDVWSPNYYLNCRSFHNIDDLGKYCMDTLCGPNDPGKVDITITLEGTDADTCSEELATQELNYTITGAADHNCLRNVIDAYKGWGYTDITFTLK